MKFKLNQKVKTPKGEGVIIYIPESDYFFPYGVRLPNGNRCWAGESDLELIPQTLQERWDSGERFRWWGNKDPITELHVFKNGVVAVTYKKGVGATFENDEEFLQNCEPIPSEPETRWVNVYVKGECIANNIGKKEEDATFSVQQKLENGKWVNV